MAFFNLYLIPLTSSIYINSTLDCVIEQLKIPNQFNPFQSSLWSRFHSNITYSVEIWQNLETVQLIFLLQQWFWARFTWPKLWHNQRLHPHRKWRLVQGLLCLFLGWPYVLLCWFLLWHLWCSELQGILAPIHVWLVLSCTCWNYILWWI